MELSTARAADHRFNIFVLTAFLVVTAIASTQHAMWKDEIQAFLIARDSATPWDIIQHLRLDGHPLLWYLLIWPGARLTWNPETMKPISLAVSTIGLSLFLWRGPWSRLEKLLWPFGYFVLYEYTVKNRAYCVGAALLMCFCALWPVRRQHILAIALVLGLMANVHLYFGIIAIGCIAALAADRYQHGGWRGLLPESWRDIAAAFIFLGFAIFAAYVAAPPRSGDFATPHAGDLSSALLAFIQIGAPGTILLPHYDSPIVLFIVGVPIGLVLVVMFLFVWLRAARHDAAALTLFLVPIPILVATYMLAYRPSIQHAGVLMFLLIAAEWIRRSDSSASEQPRPLSNLLTSVLGIHATIGLILVGIHIMRPAAHGPAVAAYIRAQGWAAQPVAGIGTALTSVCGYLQAPSCYYAERRRWNSYFPYTGITGPDIFTEGDADADIAQFAAASAAAGPNVTFVLAQPWRDDPAAMARHGFRKVASFTGAPFDNYQLYRKGD